MLDTEDLFFVNGVVIVSVSARSGEVRALQVPLFILCVSRNEQTGCLHEQHSHFCFSLAETCIAVIFVIYLRVGFLLNCFYIL